MTTLFEFNGTDLTGFNTWRTQGGDPATIFSVVSNEINITGVEYGQISTQQGFRPSDGDLGIEIVVEWYWLVNQYDSPFHGGGRAGDKAKNSSCVLAVNQIEDSWDDRGREGLEINVFQSGCGDFIILGPNGEDGTNPNDDIRFDTEIDPSPPPDTNCAWQCRGMKIWQPGGTATTISGDQRTTQESHLHADIFGGANNGVFVDDQDNTRVGEYENQPAPSSFPNPGPYPDNITRICWLLDGTIESYVNGNLAARVWNVKYLGNDFESADKYIVWDSELCEMRIKRFEVNTLDNPAGVIRGRGRTQG